MCELVLVASCGEAPPGLASRTRPRDSRKLNRVLAFYLAHHSVFTKSGRPSPGPWAVANSNPRIAA